MTDKINKTDEEWRQELSETEYDICRHKGTEPAFSGEYFDSKDKGIYRCRCCGEPLFKSEAKYDSGSGWPSFYAPIASSIIREESDISLSRERTEIICDRCGAHLGHVFSDGPQPTGLRYCVNSVSLKLDKSD
ncbi:MAG TPA: peptide-methionine (R)-S-oxide reductase [Gammaproteobacteria bacterium]|nr:peptide-methionine (R)-S-oxide reductase [Gammaproteobacteria bacterium]